MYQDKFGFLSYSTPNLDKIEIELGTIEPLENYHEIEEQIKKEQHRS